MNFWRIWGWMGIGLVLTCFGLALSGHFISSLEMPIVTQLLFFGLGCFQIIVLDWNWTKAFGTGLVKERNQE